MITGALWFSEKNRAVIRDEKLGELRKGQCLVQTAFSCLSLGTERNVLGGRVPPALYEQMTVPYMGGEFSFPVKYGYSITGRVIAGPESIIGKPVHAMHPHQGRCIVSASDITLLPAGLPLQRATLLSNLETVINATWDSEITLGETALVVGFGNIGSLLARVLQDHMGIAVTVTEQNSLKRTLARQLGFNTVDIPEPGSFDVAFHTSGTSAGLQSSLEAVGYEGRVIELSWYGLDQVSVSLGGTFHSQRKKIICSQVSNIPSRQKARFSYDRRRQVAFNLLQDQAFDHHISKVIDFEKLPGFFEAGSRGDELIIAVKY